jgi:hypothetical protein
VDIEGAPFDDIVVPFEELCKACFAKKTDNFTDVVCIVFLLPWRCVDYSNQFNSQNAEQLDRIKRIISEVGPPPHLLSFPF